MFTIKQKLNPPNTYARGQALPVPGTLLIVTQSVCAFPWSFLSLFSSLKHTRSTGVSMKILPEIIRINQSLVKKWRAANKRKDREGAKR